MHWTEKRSRRFRSGPGVRVRVRACLLAGAALCLPFAGALPAHAQATDQEKTTIPATPPPPPAPPTTSARVAPRFGVVLDAAHGGNDPGARLTDHLMEKDFVLSLSVRLRSSLSAHGIAVTTTRESDNQVPPLNRAETANHAAAAACIILHATTSGSGIHLFTSSLTPINNTRFLPWETAQGAYAEQSLRLSSEVDTAMTHAEIPVTLGRTALQPLNNLTCPAVMVEISPLVHSGTTTPLTDQGYQDKLVAALLAAVEQWQHDWRQQP